MMRNQSGVLLTLVILTHFQYLGANQNFYLTSILSESIINKKIVLLMSDVEVFRISENSIRDTSSVWSMKATQNINATLSELMESLNYDYKEHRYSIDQPETEFRRAVSLQKIVNTSILSNFQTPLPSKNNVDWTIGSQGELLKNATNADYGLFVFFRGGFRSAGDAALYHAGIVSLVDFNNGKTVWFSANTKLAGDVRDPEKTMLTVLEMLENFPGVNELTH